MPKLPLDQTQWGYAIQSFMLQKHRTLEPNIVRVQILDQSPEGNVFGFVVLTRGVVPFVVREGDLQPMDLLLSVDEAGEVMFQALSERNAFAMVGGIPIGDPVTEPLKIQDSNPAINYAGLPGMLNSRNSNNSPALQGGSIFSATQPVKLASEAIAAADTEKIGELLKAAHDAGVLEHVQTHHYESLRDALMTQKKASDESRPTLVVMEPKYDKAFLIEKVAVLTDKGEYDLPTRQAYQFASEIMDTEKAASLVRGDILHWTDRRTEPLLQHNAGAGTSTEITEPGIYDVNGTPAKAFKTTYLDGKPSRNLLVVSAEGFRLAPRIYGKAWTDSLDDEQKKALYRPTAMLQGEICFLVSDQTGAATIPFKVESVIVGGGVIDAKVTPILGEGMVRLTFSGIEKAYEVEPGHLMFPNRGYQVYALNPGQLDGCNVAYSYPGDGVKITVVKGGGTFKVFEEGKPAYGPLTEGKLMFTLTDRYGLSSEAVAQQLSIVRKMGRADFHARPKEESKNPLFWTEEKQAALKLAMELNAFQVKAASSTEWANKASEFMVETLTKLAAPAQPATTDRELAPNGGGPNRPEVENPAESGVGPTAGIQGDPGAAIPSGAEPAGIQDIADLMTAFAMGQIPPEELNQTYSDLVSKLTEAENLLGKVLLLVQMQKADFITYNEAKRILDEVDKFRATLLNASMLQASTATSVPAGSPIVQ